MKINSLTLKNFRNYSSQEINFSDGINILVGANAQGKTNAAEAVFFLCTGYSPKAHNDKLVIKNGESLASIKGDAESVYGAVSVRIDFNKNDKKTIYINGLQVHRIGELLGNIYSVFFNPGELKLVQESPEDRRRFLNVSLSQMSKNYFYALQRYNKILEQRNNLLKNPDKDIIRETLPVWDMQLSEQAAKIIAARNDFLLKLAPVAKVEHEFLSDGKEDLEIKTESNYTGSLEEIKNAVYKDLSRSLEKDMRLGFTTIGPHRDDIKFTLNGLDAKIYASQGQQRTIALSLKLAETHLFYEKFSEYPILILDDVLSELDKKRQRKLLARVKNMQTIFTTTHIDRTVFKGVEYTKFTVEKGAIKQ
jgi:DNA replication and repair protein RecF